MELLGQRTNNLKDGYFVIKDLWDPKVLFCSRNRGQINYWGKKEDQFTFTDLEGQVEGSLACYNVHNIYIFILVLD